MINVRNTIHEILDNEHPMTIEELQGHLLGFHSLVLTRTEVRIALDQIQQCGSWIEGGHEVFTTHAPSIAKQRHVLEFTEDLLLESTTPMCAEEQLFWEDQGQQQLDLIRGK